MGSTMTFVSSLGSDKIGIFPGLFVEPVPTTWKIPSIHYDAGRQMSIETETGLPAFQYNTQSTGTVSGSTGTVTGSTSSSSSDSQMGINRGTDDSSSDTDFD